MRYQTGDEVRMNDRVLLWGNPAYVEFIVFNEDSPENGYYFRKFGRGVMFFGDVVGHFYCNEESLPNEEDVVFVGREGPQGQS
jgi:hypothetical protein